MNAISQISYSDLRSMAPSVFATEKHSSRSEGYTFIPTSNAVEVLLDRGFVVTQAKQARTRLADRKNFTRHMVRLRAPNVDTGTTAAPEVIITNSHDGNARFKIMGGLIVFACENGLVIADGRVESLAVRHHGNVLDSVIAGVDRVLDATIKSASVVTQWKGVSMSADMVQLFTQRAQELRWGRDQQGKLLTQVTSDALAVARRDEDAQNDLWHVFNRVQENLMTGGVSYTSNRRNAETGEQRVRHLHTRAVRGIAENVKLNQGLWALAEEFAAA